MLKAADIKQEWRMKHRTYPQIPLTASILKFAACGNISQAEDASRSNAEQTVTARGRNNDKACY